MEFTNNNLENALNKGFIGEELNSMEELAPKLLVNNTDNGEKVLTTIKHSLAKCDEFWLSAAFITASGVSTLVNIFQELEERSINGKILTSQYLNFTEPVALKRLSRFKNIELRIVTDGNFHGKGYLFRMEKFFDFVIGSSNLTAQALCINKELNLKVSAKQEGEIISTYLSEFENEFSMATLVDDNFIKNYEQTYLSKIEFKQHLPIEKNEVKEVVPNAMQDEALMNLRYLRGEGNKKALLVSACATGKTHLSAFDAKFTDPKRLLFVVHRENITKKALDTFKSIFGSNKTMGLYTGNQKEIDKDFIFSTIQTLSRTRHLQQFKPEHFDYIVIDESHRAGATSYLTILKHFKPKFILGLTGTPERTDGFDIFDLFDHNIAYELRLHRALEEDMICPFHYFGVTDLTIDGQIIEENSKFLHLVSVDRINHIIEKITFYGSDNGQTRGLIFCSSIDECITLSDEFNDRGYRTVALTGSSSENEREEAIIRLESENIVERLDYIFTVDIFNEGVDIPKLNQVVMLRPTQSAIIFVQQLGRGLRKADRKEYLTVIDFIGNYKNNFLIPIALYGDTSYNKDKLRRVLTNSDRFIPGVSTINFDRISKEKIFSAISQTNLQPKKDLVHDYSILKFKLGRIPMMMDFLDHASRDPMQYVSNAKSYYNFVQGQEESLQGKISTKDMKLLEQLSSEINNSIRVEESFILLELLNNKKVTVKSMRQGIKEKYNYSISDKTIESSLRNLNFKFVLEQHMDEKSNKKKRISFNEAYGISTIQFINNNFEFSKYFAQSIKNEILKKFLLDSVKSSIHTFEAAFDIDKFDNGFSLYQKYSRKDVFRLLNWKENPVAQNVGGYMISPEKDNCPIFVNYHKEENISSSTKYEDRFLSRYSFEWFSKSNRSLSSADVIAIKNSKDGLRLPLFIKKNNDEGLEFYYMGDVTPIEGKVEQTSMLSDKNKNVSVVKFRFQMNNPVSSSMYEYITDLN